MPDCCWTREQECALLSPAAGDHIPSPCFLQARVLYIDTAASNLTLPDPIPAQRLVGI